MQIQANPKLGYYEVDGFITYSKSQACLLASKTQKMPRWNFNDKVFEHFDWKTEPPGDLYDWYGVRARQIRESID